MTLKASVTLFVVMCVCGVEQCMCFPNGSVALSCSNMMPFHPPFGPSTSPSPFILSTSSATYRPGGVIKVTLEVKNSSAEFQGFLLQARSSKGNALLWPVGQFVNIDTTSFNALHCNNMENSAVSQASGTKRKKIELTWEAPNNRDSGEIYFSATLVQDYTTFWARLNSSSLKLDSSWSENSAAGVIASSALLFINLLSLTAFC